MRWKTADPQAVAEASRLSLKGESMRLVRQRETDYIREVDWERKSCAE